MLLANRKISKFIYDEEKKSNEPNISIYRVHDKPDPIKCMNLIYLYEVLVRVRFIDGLIPSTELNKLLKN